MGGAGGKLVLGLCVDYLETPEAASTAARTGKPKVDYKDLLTPGEFETFAKLRAWRKKIAQEEAVPVYLVFTNEQLAQVVQQQVTTKAALAKIEGIGDARVKKYGVALLEIMRGQGENDGQASRKSV